MKQLGLSLKQESSVIKKKKKGKVGKKGRKRERERERGGKEGRKEEGSKGINIGAELGDHKPEFDFFLK